MNHHTWQLPGRVARSPRPRAIAALCGIFAGGLACGAAPRVSAPAAPSRSALRARLAPCNLPGVSEPLLCGDYPVWENRAARRGRKIALHVVVLPALGSDVAPDPLFVFAGGPGEGVTDEAAGWAQERQLRAHRDIVLIDQRGTGRSHRLDCKLPRDPSDVQAYFEPPFPADEVRRCRGELAAGADLTQYTTSIAADDVDEVRAWLGYDKINLQGGSYGTYAAQVYLRQHGDHVRTATLIGVAALDQYVPLYHARDGKRALDRLFETCARDPVCAAAFPELPAEHDRVLAALDRARASATVASPVDHRPVSVTIARDIFAEAIRFTLYNAASAAATPYVIHRAAQGDFAPIARIALVWQVALRGSLASGLYLSVTCAEDVPFITPDAIEPAIAGTYLRGYRVDMQIAACREWPRGEIPQDLHQPVRSDVPVLLISGPFDPVTPPGWAEQVAAHLPHGRQVTIPDGHHGAGGLSHGDCVMDLSTRFVAQGTVDGLDATCVTDMRRPPFVADEAGFAALLQRAADG